jgi:hypothetical protein
VKGQPTQAEVAEWSRKYREEARQKLLAELPEANAFLSSLTEHQWEFLRQAEKHEGLRSGEYFNEADRYGDEPSWQAAQAKAAGHALVSDADERELKTDEGRVHYARWARSELFFYRAPMTPEQADQKRKEHAAKWDAIYEQIGRDGKKAAKKSGRNERYRVKLAASEPKRAALERAKVNLKKAEARLRKAVERVAIVEAETRDSDVAVSVRAQLYLPEARAILPEVEKTVAKWQAEVSKAEQALKE